ncbi:hypothetical protein JKP88DRAFT_319105 [Tribonema minus]|uniref:Uncharacterized protein n=1 Tax=Tribonema minus TaxID=303371 RepID=A0A835YW08_9STRA|nr:hypothetical protein JKP88DRAFT_319105 [Tribonema minus]
MGVLRLSLEDTREWFSETTALGHGSAVPLRCIGADFATQEEIARVREKWCKAGPSEERAEQASERRRSDSASSARESPCLRPARANAGIRFDGRGQPPSGGRGKVGSAKQAESFSSVLTSSLSDAELLLPACTTEAASPPAAAAAAAALPSQRRHQRLLAWVRTLPWRARRSRSAGSSAPQSALPPPHGAAEEAGERAAAMRAPVAALPYFVCGCGAASSDEAAQQQLQCVVQCLRVGIDVKLRDRRGRSTLRTLFIDGDGQRLCWVSPGAATLTPHAAQSLRLDTVLEFREGSGRCAERLYLVCAAREPLIIEPARRHERALLREGLQHLIAERQLLRTDRETL